MYTFLELVDGRQVPLIVLVDVGAADAGQSGGRASDGRLDLALTDEDGLEIRTDQGPIFGRQHHVTVETNV